MPSRAGKIYPSEIGNLQYELESRRFNDGRETSIVDGLQNPQQRIVDELFDLSQIIPDSKLEDKSGIWNLEL